MHDPPLDDPSWAEMAAMAAAPERASYDLPPGPRPGDVPGPVGIGARIVWLRERRGMSQAALARKTGLSQSSVSQAEGGSSNPRAETLYTIAQALGVSVGALFGEPVEALAPEDARFYRDFTELAPEAQEDVRVFVLFRWMRQEGYDPFAMLAGRRDADLARYEAREERRALHRAQESAELEAEQARELARLGHATPQPQPAPRPFARRSRGNGPHEGSGAGGASGPGSDDP